METEKKLSKKTKVVIGAIISLALIAIIIAVIVFGGNDKNNETNTTDENNINEVEKESETILEEESEKESEDESEKITDVLKHQYGIVYDDETYTYTCRWEAEYDINGELLKKTYYDPTGYRKVETHIKDELANTMTVTYEVVTDYDRVVETFDTNPLWENAYEDENDVDVVNIYYEEYELAGSEYEVIKMEPFGGEVILYNDEVYVDLSGVLEQDDKEVIDTLKMLYGDDVMETLAETIENCATYEIEGLGTIKAILVDDYIKQVASNVGHDIDDGAKNGLVLIDVFDGESFYSFDNLLKGISEREILNNVYTHYFGVINYEHNGNTVTYLVGHAGVMTSTGVLFKETVHEGLTFDEESLMSNMETVTVYRHKDWVFSKIQKIVYDENGNVKENIEFNPDEISAISAILVIPQEEVKETEYDKYNRVTKEIFESGNYVEYSYWGDYNNGSYCQVYYGSDGECIVSIREEYYDNKLRRKEINMGYWEDYNIYVFEYSYFDEEKQNEKDYSVTPLFFVNEAVLYNGEVYVDIYDEDNIDYEYKEYLELYVAGFFEKDGKDGEAMLQNMIKADENCSKYILGELGEYKALKLDAKNVDKIYIYDWGQDIPAETGILMIHDDKTVSFAYSLDMTQGISSVVKLDITDVEDVFIYEFNWTEMYFVKNNGEMIRVIELVDNYFED